MIKESAAQGARFIALPEAVDLLDGDHERIHAHAWPVHHHPAIAAFRETAKSLGIWLLVGSVSARDETNQVVNRCVFVDARGNIVCHYDKIHLFDAIPGSAVFTESQIYARGTKAVVTSMPWGRLGLSICYDLRFPHLYRALAQAGANILAIPAAFMQVTGEAHWHALMRARAIENGCFVVAPAQCGLHYGTRRSFGHSLIIDPWGQVLAEAGTTEEIVYAALDLSQVQRARTAIPSLVQDRAFTLLIQ